MDWKKLIANVAPVLAGAVSGPLAPLAMAGTAAISNLLLGKSDATDAKLETAVQAMTPEQMEALRQLDLQWDAQQKQYILSLGSQDQAVIDSGDKDTADARARDIALQVKNGENWRADAAVIFVCLGLIACLITLIFLRDKISGEAVGIISVIAGIFGGCLKDYFNFEFGSSRESRTKDAVIANVATTPVGVNFEYTSAGTRPTKGA